MKSNYMKCIIVLIVFAIGMNDSKAQNSDSLKGKEIGLNFRNLWFGSTAEIVLRKPNGQNKFKRKTLRISGDLNEQNSPFSGGVVSGLPDGYYTNMNSNLSINLSLGREKRVDLYEQLYFYHGPSFITNVGFSKNRSAFGSVTSPQRTDNTNLMLGLGLGYFGGIGYKVSDRFSIQIDNLLQIQAATVLQNQTVTTFDTNTQLETSTNTFTDKLNMSMSIPGNNISRIWVVFNF